MASMNYFLNNNVTRWCFYNSHFYILQANLVSPVYVTNFNQDQAENFKISWIHRGDFLQVLRFPPPITEILLKVALNIINHKPNWMSIIISSWFLITIHLTTNKRFRIIYHNVIKQYFRPMSNSASWVTAWARIYILLFYLISNFFNLSLGICVRDKLNLVK
jgi:hypothetical protein